MAAWPSQSSQRLVAFIFGFRSQVACTFLFGCRLHALIFGVGQLKKAYIAYFFLHGSRTYGIFKFFFPDTTYAKTSARDPKQKKLSDLCLTRSVDSTFST